MTARIDPRIERIERFIERLHSFEIIINSEGNKVIFTALRPIGYFGIPPQDFAKKDEERIIKDHGDRDTFSEWLSFWISEYEDCRGPNGNMPFAPWRTRREMAIESLALWIARGFTRHFFDENSDTLTKKLNTVESDKALLYQELEQTSGKIVGLENEKRNCQEELADLKEKTQAKKIVCPNCREPIDLEHLSLKGDLGT